jgi:acyl phosphate:glycerol-3-phosphate acyltransferase
MHIYVIVAVVSYLLGSIPFGYILVRLFLKTDVRSLGSGNIGATNVGRTGHRGLAIATLLLDAGKGSLAVWHGEYAAQHHLIGEGRSSDVPWPLVVGAMAALFAVLGHVFPVWLKFKGGKGVATAVGAFALLAPKAVLVALAVFLVTVAITRFVSLGSILGSIAFPLAVYWLAGDRYGAALPHVVGAISLTSALVILKHHANIRRLMAGTENKLGAKAPLPQNPIQTEKNA